MRAKQLSFLLLIAATLLIVIARCEDDKDYDYGVTTEAIDGSETPDARKGEFYCVGRNLESVSCHCKFSHNKTLDFSRVSLLEANHTLRISDCKEVILNFQRKPKLLLDAIEIFQVEKLIVKSKTLGGVDNLIMRHVKNLVAERTAFENLTARRVEFDDVYIPKDTVFRPKYIFNELKITNSVLESEVAIHVNNANLMGSRIVISNNTVSSPNWSLYSDDIRLTHNSFMSEKLNISLRYVNHLTAINNLQREQRLPNISGAGQRTNVTFKIDTNYGENMTESEIKWLSSFSYELRQKTFAREFTNQSRCSGEEASDDTKKTLEVICPDSASYRSFVEAKTKHFTVRKERHLKDELNTPTEKGEVVPRSVQRDGAIQRSSRSGASGTTRYTTIVVMTFALIYLFLCHYLLIL